MGDKKTPCKQHHYEHSKLLHEHDGTYEVRVCTECGHQTSSKVVPLQG